MRRERGVRRKESITEGLSNIGVVPVNVYDSHPSTRFFRYSTVPSNPQNTSHWGTASAASMPSKASSLRSLRSSCIFNFIERMKAYGLLAAILKYVISSYKDDVLPCFK